MATKSISELTAASQVNNADLFVLEQNNVAKKLTGQLLLSFLNAHGGIASTSYTPPVAPSLEGTLTLTMADGTSTSVPIYNGAKGDTGAQGAAFTYEDFTPEQLAALKGEQGERGLRGFDGNSAKVWIKYASVEPTSDADMGDIPDAWMGVYSAAFDDPPSHYTDFDWYCIKGEIGATGATGTTGDRGTYIWQSLYPVIDDGAIAAHFRVDGLVAPTTQSGSTPRRGDLIIYGDRYYFVSDEPTGNSCYVSGSYSLNSAALPSGGTTNQVLAKASNSDYDVEWQNPVGSGYTVTYGTTTYSAIKSAELVDNKTPKLTYNGRRYTVVEQSGGVAAGTYVFTCADDDGTLYWCKCESDGLGTNTWTNGSSSGGGTSDYTQLTNKPSINSVTLSGNKTAADLGMIAAPSSPSDGQFLVYSSSQSAWVAQTVPSANGVNF